MGVAYQTAGKQRQRILGRAKAGTARRRRPERRIQMGKYLVIASYTADGLRELTANGASARIEASKKLVAEAGGSIESFYYALGSDDAFIVCDLPDNVAAAATAIAAGASGVVASRIVPLLTADEIDEAVSRKLQLAGLDQ
jgi:uncharacterized protein with GYD domain